MEQIRLEDLEKYHNRFVSNPMNEKIQEELKLNELQDFFLDENIIKENEYSFNIELPETKIYNQIPSLRCWLFCLINLVKDDMAKNLNIPATEFELSTNYLSFFDKLEKSNTAYEYIINSKSKTIQEFMIEMHERQFGANFYFKNPVRETGRIEYSRDLMKKYGIVPMSIMPNTKNAMSSTNNIKLFTRKVKRDMYNLIYAKSSSSYDDLEIMKDKMLCENYKYLSLIYGEPAKTFSYSYTNIDNKIIEIKDITPIEFFNKFCSYNLDDFVLIANLPMYNKEYYKKYRRKYSDNIYNKNAIEYINLPIDLLKEYAVKQLKSGLPVCIACENKTYRDNKSTILDT